MMEDMKNFLRQSMLITVGSLICVFAIKAIIMPHALLSRGMTGFTLLIYYNWQVLPLGLIYFIINVPVFILGWWFVGRRFILYSIWGLAIYSLALSLMNVEIEISDPLLAAIIGGAILGIGTALILRSSGSSGGQDILCVIMNKLFSLSLGTGAIIINTVVMILSALIFPMEIVLYTLVFIFVSAQFTDKIFHGMTNRRAAIIISDNWRAISDALTKKRIGITILKGHGGYRGAERTLLYSVITSRSAPLLKATVTSIDESAFIAIMEASDVTGLEIGNQPHW